MPISKASRWRGATLAITAALAALAGAAFYLPALDTGFASEDFLVLAHLSRETLLDTLRHELSSPWLGLAPIGFWRPVSTVLLALELRLFGLHPARFHAAHLAIHTFDAWLLAMIVTLVVGERRRAPTGDQPPAAGVGGALSIAAASAALFAVHPFHPSAALFIGAFATLFSAAFSLLAIYCFLAARHCDATRERARRRLDLAAILFFVLALGSYEGAATVPLVLLVTTILLPGQIRASMGAGARASLRWFGLSLPSSPCWLSISLARLLVLGTSIGGYAAFRSRFLSAPLERARDLAAALGRILHPHYGHRRRITVGLGHLGGRSRRRARRRGGSPACRPHRARGPRLDRALPRALRLRRTGARERSLRPPRDHGCRRRDRRTGGRGRRALAAARSHRDPRRVDHRCIGLDRPAAPHARRLRSSACAGDVRARRRSRRGSRAQQRGHCRAGREPAGLRQGRRARTDRQGFPVRPR